MNVNGSNSKNIDKLLIMIMVKVYGGGCDSVNKGEGESK